MSGSPFKQVPLRDPRSLTQARPSRSQKAQCWRETQGLWRRRSQPALGHHLRQLRLARVVARRREGPNAFYALAPGPARDLLRYVLP